MKEHQAREEICRIGASLFARGYVHASAGNISIRLPDDAGFLITPTDACLGFLDPAQLALLDAQGRQISGERASKTIAVHRAIYQANARIGRETHCVIHTHSTHCVALSLAFGNDIREDTELLPPITPYFVMKVGHVPLIPYHRPGAPEAAAACVARIEAHARAGHPIQAVMLARLGPNVWHGTPAVAMATLEELEETARLWLMTQPRPQALSQDRIEELRQHFGAQW